MFILLARQEEINNFLKAAENTTRKYSGLKSKLINYVKSGWIRPIELEIFLPILRRRVEELLKILPG